MTDYHKGYSTTGTTKIIHRYLPIKVSELVVYYVWLIVPFIDQLVRLSRLPGLRTSSMPYLWGSFILPPALGTRKRKRAERGEGEEGGEEGDKPWPLIRLSNILNREFRQHVGTELNILTWRHAIIAISRQHL